MTFGWSDDRLAHKRQFIFSIPLSGTIKIVLIFLLPAIVAHVNSLNRQDHRVQLYLYNWRWRLLVFSYRTGCRATERRMATTPCLQKNKTLLVVRVQK